MALIRLRDDITGWAKLGDDWDGVISDSKARLAELVNEFFRAKLFGIPDVVEFVDSLGAEA
jgi:hypothetical protein